MVQKRTKNLHSQIKSKHQILDELVEIIVSTAQPLRIILFGSVAKGKANADSDLDILVVMPDGTLRRNIARILYQALNELGVPKDIIVVTESDLRTYGTNHSLIIAPALAEGKELYHAVA